jgi:ELWxxDGT repeat protein
MVKDITPGPDTLVPGQLVAYGGKLFFGGDDGTNGEELWVSDGTEGGTYMVKDIHPSESSRPQRFRESGGKLFFQATDDSTGAELWVIEVIDGTPQEPEMVKDINPEGPSSSPTILTDVNGTLFFVANDGQKGVELWKSDGTESGTDIVKDIMPDDGHSHPRDLVNLNDVLIFTAIDETNGRAL